MVNSISGPVLNSLIRSFCEALEIQVAFTEAGQHVMHLSG